MIKTLIIETAFCELMPNECCKLVLTDSQLDDLILTASISKERGNTHDIIELRTRFYDEEGYMGTDSEAIKKYITKESNDT